MRLLLVAPGYASDEHDWGMPAVRHLVSEIAEEATVDLLALRYPLARESYRLDGVTVHPMGGGEAPRAARLTLLSRARRAAGRLASKTEPDLVHALWADEAGAIAVSTGRPTIVSVMGGELVADHAIRYGGARSRLNRRLLRYAIGRARAVTAGSRQLARLVEAATSVRPEVVPVMTRPGTRTGDGSIAGRPILLSVGSFDAVKDHLTLIDAFADVKRTHAGATLHLVGDGPHRGDIERRAESRGVSGDVHFHGRRPPSEMGEWYGSADLFVQSSRYESQGVAVAEAVEAGCSVAGTATGVLPEIVSTDRLAPPGDAGRLAETIRRALVGGEQGRVSGHDEAVERFRALYRRLAT